MSTKQTPRPLAHYFNPDVNTYLSVKLNSININETVAVLEYAWKEHFPGVPFEFFFLDEVCEMHYRMDKQINKALKIFAILAIFIAVLGLFGLSTFSTQQRGKEIGIRKIMGATVNKVMFILSKETLRLLAISAILSIPAWFGIKAWLQNFAYPIDFNILYYAGASLGVTLVVLIIALLTVSINSYRAATANPAQSLRAE